MKNSGPEGKDGGDPPSAAGFQILSRKKKESVVHFKGS